MSSSRRGSQISILPKPEIGRISQFLPSRRLYLKFRGPQVRTKAAPRLWPLPSSANNVAGTGKPSIPRVVSSFILRSRYYSSPSSKSAHALLYVRERVTRPAFQDVRTQFRLAERLFRRRPPISPFTLCFSRADAVKRTLTSRAGSYSPWTRRDRSDRSRPWRLDGPMMCNF
jgi:hypothetical protein